MAWTDIAWIVVVCTCMNHLGLVAAVERIIRHRLPVADCPKCATFWATLGYLLVDINEMVAVPCGLSAWLSVLARILALSFLAAYAAVWLELLMYSVDTIYNRIYDTLSKYNPEERESD